MGLRLAYVVVLGLATLSPWRWDPALHALGERLLQALSLALTARDVVDGARNFVLFAGWGLLWALTARRPLAAVGSAALTGLALSAAVETLQLFTPHRTTSLVDILTNTGGALGGALVARPLLGALRGRRGRPSFVGIPAAVFAGAYGGAALLEAAFPVLRHVPQPGVYGGPLARLRHSASTFGLSSLFELPWGEALLFFPAGLFLAAALVEAGADYRRAGRRAAWAGLLLALVGELAHGPLGQPMEIGPVLLHAAGIAAGALAAARWLPGSTRRLRGRARPLALASAYTLLLAGWAWRPFRLQGDVNALAEELGLRRWIPLRALGLRVDLYGVADVCESFLLFAPLGALLAVWPLRRRGLLSGPLPAVWLALALELGQVVIAERFFDATDALIASGGALVGWIVTRRAGFAPYGAMMVGSARRP